MRVLVYYLSVLVASFNVHSSCSLISNQQRTSRPSQRQHVIRSSIGYNRNLLYSLNEDHQDSHPTPNKIASLPWPSLAMATLPIVPAIFPLFLSWAKSLPPYSTEQIQVITALFTSSQVYLYANAATIVALAAVRGANDSPKLGRRLTDLTEELLYRPDLKAKWVEYQDSSIAEVENTTKKPDLILSMADSGLQETLDEVSANRQALILPLLVSALLAVSVFFVPIGNLGSLLPQENAYSLELADFIKNILPYASQLWNSCLLTLFTRAETRRLFHEWIHDGALGSSSLDIPPAVEWVWAVVIAGIACFFTPAWVLQNFVNMALAIAVARVIQLDTFVAVVGALCLLTIYDASSVFLIPSANAFAEATSYTLSIAPTDVASVPLTFQNVLLADKSIADSAMGSVALQKLNADTFQPGLLVSKIDGRLVGSLGLGDAVFPSLLATFVRRYDNDNSNKSLSRPSFFVVCLFGYLLGCMACEFVPMFLSTLGIPALVFIVPSMLGSVLVVAALFNEMQDLGEYQPSAKKRHQ